MSKYRIINLFDKLFITISIFLILFSWINFFIRDLFATFFLSLIFSASLTFVIFYLFNRKKEKSLNKKKYLKDINENFLAFRLLSKNEQIKFINDTLQDKFHTQIVDDKIQITNGEKKRLIMVATDIEKIDNFNLVNLLQGHTDMDEIEIICNDYIQEINTSFLLDTEIIFTDKKRLYDEYFYKYNSYPNHEMLNTKIIAPKLKDIARNFFTPNKAKSYFICGLILIFSSIILPYHFYYLIFGTVLLSFSVICKLRPLFKC